MAKTEGIYDERAHLTRRAELILRPLAPMLKKLFAQARTPRECMDLERAFLGDVSIAASIRILSFIVAKGGRYSDRRNYRKSSR